VLECVKRFFPELNKEDRLDYLIPVTKLKGAKGRLRSISDTARL